MKIMPAVAALVLVLAPVSQARVVDLDPGLAGYVETPSGPGSFRQPNLTLVFSQSGKEVGRTKTDGRGLWAINLPPGKYSIDAEVPKRDDYMRMTPRAVSVVPGFRGALRIVWDIGLG